MMKRRHMLCAGVGLGLSGCGLSTIARGGETASYSLFNGTKDQHFEMAGILRPGSKYEIVRVLRMPALPPNAIGWRGGGALAPADTGHRPPATGCQSVRQFRGDCRPSRGKRNSKETWWGLTKLS